MGTCFYLIPKTWFEKWESYTQLLSNQKTPDWHSIKSFYPGPIDATELLDESNLEKLLIDKVDIKEYTNYVLQPPDK